MIRTTSSVCLLRTRELSDRTIRVDGRYSVMLLLLITRWHLASSLYFWCVLSINVWVYDTGSRQFTAIRKSFRPDWFNLTNGIIPIDSSQQVCKQSKNLKTQEQYFFVPINETRHIRSYSSFAEISAFDRLQLSKFINSNRIWEKKIN